MKSFKQYLNEIFGEKYIEHNSWYYEGDFYYFTKFSDGTSIILMFRDEAGGPWGEDKQEGGYEVEFMRFNEDVTTELVAAAEKGDMPTIKSKMFKGEMGVTSQGASVEVFSAAINLIKEFIDMEDPVYITFSAKRKETTRVRLYDRLVKRISHMFRKVEIDPGDDEALEERYKVYVLYA